jgi:hypothetical protein
MMMVRLAGLLLGIFAFLSATPAAACSVVRGYRVPSNFELVHRADLIVLARVASGPTSFTADREPRVMLAPVRTLKGLHGGGPLAVHGVIGSHGVPLISAPTPLRAPHFSALGGACIRTNYPEGGLVVAMFEHTPEGLRQIGAPFARAVEDVESEDGLWVRAVGEYLAAQRGVAPSALRAAGERLRAALAARRDDFDAQAMANDLRTWLDETEPDGPTLRGGAVWIWTGGTDGAGATLRGHTPGRSAGFRCTAGERALRVDLNGVAGVPQLALVIGGRRFDAEGEARLTMEGGTNIASGLIPLTAELAALMRGSPAPSGIAVDGANLLIAPTADVLQKLAIVCATVLTPGTAAPAAR